MDEEEARAIEEQLRAAARAAGLEWVIEQVDAVSREGKPQFKRPKGRIARDQEEIVPAELTRKRGVLASEPYTMQERTALLASALSRTIRDSATVERAAFEALIGSDRVESVMFGDELGTRPDENLGEERGRIERVAPERERLLQALGELENRLRS